MYGYSLYYLVNFSVNWTPYYKIKLILKNMVVHESHQTGDCN